MRARHKEHHEKKHEEHKMHEGPMRKRRAAGGEVMETSGNPNVFKEAKKGENIGVIGGVKSKARMDRPERAKGGRVHHEHKEEPMKHRATGGRVGSDQNPFSSAARVSAPSERKRGGKC